MTIFKIQYLPHLKSKKFQITFISINTKSALKFSLFILVLI
jgi:hypothetical protein